MNAESAYTGDYIDSCRWRIESEVAAFDLLRDQAPGDGSMDSAIQEIEDEYFVAVASQLEGMFAGRHHHGAEPGSGVLAEMRAVVASLNGNGGRFDPPAEAGLDPDTTVLGLAPGDPIRLDRDSFQDLADAFFDAIESLYRESN